MPMVVIGVLLLLAKMAGFGPVAEWSWWVIAAPFIAAVLWWQFADSSGLTKRREMQKMEKRKAERRDKNLQALGLDTRRHRPVNRAPNEAPRKLSESADPTQAERPVAPQRRDPRL